MSHSDAAQREGRGAPLCIQQVGDIVRQTHSSGARQPCDQLRGQQLCYAPRAHAGARPGIARATLRSDVCNCRELMKRNSNRCALVLSAPHRGVQSLLQLPAPRQLEPLRFTARVHRHRSFRGRATFPRHTLTQSLPRAISAGGPRGKFASSSSRAKTRGSSLGRVRSSRKRTFRYRVFRGWVWRGMITSLEPDRQARRSPVSEALVRIHE